MYIFINNYIHILYLNIFFINFNKGLNMDTILELQKIDPKYKMVYNGLVTLINTNNFKPQIFRSYIENELDEMYDIHAIISNINVVEMRFDKIIDFLYNCYKILMIINLKNDTILSCDEFSKNLNYELATKIKCEIKNDTQKVIMMKLIETCELHMIYVFLEYIELLNFRIKQYRIIIN